MFKFDYEGWKYTTNDPNKLSLFIDEWIKDHWELFVEWSDYLVTEDDYEQYIEDFAAETITESSDA